MTFEGGSLRLKGDKKKVKKKKKEAQSSIGESTGAASLTKTAAELRFEEIKKERLEERAAKIAEKSHKDRVNEFNSYLSRLSEHHDIRNFKFNNSSRRPWLRFVLYSLKYLQFLF